MATNWAMWRPWHMSSANLSPKKKAKAETLGDT